MKIRMTSTTRILSAALLALAFASAQASAQAQNTVYLSKDASQCEIFKGLSRTLPEECRAGRPVVKTRGLTRGIVMLPDRQGAEASQTQTETQDHTQVASAPQETTAPEPATKELSVSFRAEFEWNSARLTPSARKVIDRVAQVLNHELMRDKVFRIEGHADSSGPDAYNMILSEKRARAVQEYLVETHGVSANRLQYVGKGETEPFDPQNPASGVNRRVEFRNLSG